MNVAFLHPDLGFGGAERVVVDAATHLVGAGHRVVVLTAHHDPARAFPPTVDGTLDVRVRSAGIPAHVRQRLRAPCSVARMAWLALAATRLRERPDVVVCDLVPHAIPLLRLLRRIPVVYYCHHPDRLLATAGGALYRAYRAPFDRLEEAAIGMADRVVVNSRFTAARFREAFPRLAGLEPDVVYPGVDVLPCPDLPEEPEPGPVTLLSLGRDDPRKSLGLAIEAIAALRGRIPPALFARLRLVIAGGRDARLRTRGALEAIARRLGVEAHVALQASPSETERLALLSACRCVVFTPAAEHFGYVPVEAMAAGRPVVAVNHGGPTETIADGETGFLCAPTPDAFATALARLLGEGGVAARMGRAGRARVAAGFSRAAFGARIERILREAVENY